MKGVDYMKKFIFDGFVIFEDDNEVTLEKLEEPSKNLNALNANREFEKKLFKKRDEFLYGSEARTFNDNYDLLLDRGIGQWSNIFENYEVEYFKNHKIISVKFNEIWE